MSITILSFSCLLNSVGMLDVHIDIIFSIAFNVSFGVYRYFTRGHGNARPRAICKVTCTLSLHVPVPNIFARPRAICKVICTLSLRVPVPSSLRGHVRHAGPLASSSLHVPVPPYLWCTSAKLQHRNNPHRDTYYITCHTCIYAYSLTIPHFDAAVSAYDLAHRYVYHRGQFIDACAQGNLTGHMSVTTKHAFFTKAWAHAYAS